MADVEIAPWLKSLPLAPEFHPTEAEFADPIAYISKIEAEARNYGICKIVPPLPKVPKKTVIASLNRSLLQSLDATAAATHGTASNTGRSMSGSAERNQSEVGRSIADSTAAGLGRSMSGSSQMTNRGTLSTDVGVGGELKAKFNTRRQQVGWSARRSRGQLHSLAQKLVWQSGESYTIEQFEAKAKQFSRTRLRTSKELSPLVIETLFWKATADKPITVEYGNDIPGSAFGEPLQSDMILCPTSRSGKKRKRGCFQSGELCAQTADSEPVRPLVDCKEPELDDIHESLGLNEKSDDISQHQRIESVETFLNHGTAKGILRAKSDPISSNIEAERVVLRKKVTTGYERAEKGGPGWKVANSPWNMRIIARSPGSPLRYMPDEVPGVTSPMVYIGMLFSWFAWHVEDHELHSLNYLHTGAPKTWYAVPGEVAPALEEVVRVFGYGNHLDPQAAFALLGEKTTVMSPEVLIAAGVPCCRLVQNPGEFVVTFPRAYHLGFSHGFNCGEAANFATPAWLEVAKEAATRRAAMNYLPMLSHQQLLYLLALSFPARIPSTLPSEPRSSRLKDKKRSLGEVTVKTVFAKDVALNNWQLGLLLDAGVSSCLLLGDDVGVSPVQLGHSEQIKLAGASVPPECGISASSPCTTAIVQQESASAVSLDQPNSFSSSLWRRQHKDTISAINGNSILLTGPENHQGSQYESLVSALSLEWGTLPCAACGVLCFSSMAIVQPEWKGAASSIPMHQGNDNLAVHLSCIAAGKHEIYAGDFVSDALHNSSSLSRSSLSSMEFKPESESGMDREVGGIQMSENPHAWDNSSRDDFPVLQKMMGTKQISEHCVQNNDISSPEKVVAKLCSDDPGHKNCAENSPHCTASAEDQVSEHRVQRNDISFPEKVVAKLCSDNPGQKNCVDNSPHCTASAEDSEASSEQHISDSMAVAASQKHYVEGPKCLANGSQGKGEGICTSASFREGDETKNAMNKEGFEHAVDKVGIQEKDESESTAHVILENQSLSVLELLAATYHDSSDSEDDMRATLIEETEDFGAHFCPNSAFSSFSADEVGCTVDAPWHCSMSKDEWVQEGLLSSSNVHESIINDPSVTMHSNELKKVFVCKEVLLQQCDGKYELREYMPKVEACLCVKDVPESKSQSKSMEGNAIDTDKCDSITNLSSGVNEEDMVPPSQIEFQNITQSTSNMLLISSTSRDVELVVPGLHLTPTASEVRFDGPCSEALPSKALEFQISKCMATNDPEDKPLIITEITQVPDGSIEESKEVVKSDITEHIRTCRNDASEHTTRNDEEGQCWDLAVEYSAETDDKSKQDDLNTMIDLIEAGANNQGKGRHSKAYLNASMTEQSVVVGVAKSNLEMENIQLKRSEDKSDGLSMPAAENPCIAESKEVQFGADFNLFHEQTRKPFSSLPSRGVARPRFLCLEHALEAHHHLKSLGGVYMVIICHSGLVNIEQRAKGLAEELGLDHHWRSIPFRKANQEEQNFINLALDIEEEGEHHFQDWVAQLGMSICHNLKRRDRFWADHSHRWYRESFGSSTESYPYPMNNSVVLSYEAQIQPSLNASVLKSDSEGCDAGKASKQKKISVAGRWCGRVWMNNQVHPVLGGCHNAQVPLQPIFPLLSPLQVLAAGSIDNTRSRGRPRKHAVQHGEEFCLEANMKGCSLEADIGMSFKGKECSVQPLKEVEEGAGETERGVCSVPLQPDTQSRFLLEGIGRKRKVGESNTIVDPAHAMLGMANWKKRREIESDTVDSSVLNNSCLVSGLQRPSSYSCHLSSTYFYQGLGDEVKSISCTNALTGNYMSSFDIPAVELGKICLPGEIMINSALSAAYAGQDVAAARESSPSTVLQERTSMDGTVRVTNTPILLPKEPCFSEEVICKTGTENNSCLHGIFRKRACSVFDGHRHCLGKIPATHSHGLEPECAESKFTEYTPAIALPEVLESVAAEGSECARDMKRRQEDQCGTSHLSSFPVEGPSTRLRTRNATKLKKIGDEEVADDGADNMTVRNVKKAPKQSHKKTKKTRVKDVEDESGSCPCDIEGCNMTFSSKQELNMHKRNTCTFTGCGKRFGSHKYLLQHRRVHIDDRPLKCSHKGCKMTFKWPWARTEHLRVHTGERPYKCPVPGCGLTFRFVSDFSRHKRKTGHTKQ